MAQCQSPLGEVLLQKVYGWAELEERKRIPASATFSQAPCEEDASSAFLPFPFSLLEESELMELKWHAQESPVHLLNLEVQKELLISCSNPICSHLRK